MREVTVSKVISADRESIFDFVCDLAGRPAFADHYMHDYRLARANPVGEGAAARFRFHKPLAKDYAELEVREVDRPRRKSNSSTAARERSSSRRTASRPRRGTE